MAHVGVHLLLNDLELLQLSRRQHRRELLQRLLLHLLVQRLHLLPVGVRARGPGLLEARFHLGVLLLQDRLHLCLLRVGQIEQRRQIVHMARGLCRVWRRSLRERCPRTQEGERHEGCFHRCLLAG